MLRSAFSRSSSSSSSPLAGSASSRSSLARAFSSSRSTAASSSSSSSGNRLQRCLAVPPSTSSSAQPSSSTLISSSQRPLGASLRRTAPWSALRQAGHGWSSLASHHRSGVVGGRALARRWLSTEAEGAEDLGEGVRNEKLRNIAIIAHVDHGKTSLVDKLLSQSGTTSLRGGERVMDSNALEQERGITIMAKQTSIKYKDYTINIVDTPGHGDFGGEVERVLGMVDGVVMLVDGTEGPMAQTKFVLSKALSYGLKPIVVLNKMDRDTIRPDEVESELFDLFVSLDASDEQLDYVTLYASAREGWAVKNRTAPRTDMTELFETIIEKVPPPLTYPDAPFSMLVTTMEHDMHLGRILVGRVRSGSVTTGDQLHGLSREAKELEKSKVLKVLGRRGLERSPIERGECGDIIGIAGFGACSVTDTICAPSVVHALPANPIDPPVLSVVLSVNDSPLAGREGTKLTSTLLRQRLYRELESNVTLQIGDTGREGALEVKGRGELQLAVLIENMRREGFEISVSPPKVLFKQEEGELLEPQEEVTVDVPTEFSGVVLERFGLRKGELVEMKTDGDKARLIFMCPSRSLIGFRQELNQLCRGTVVLHHLFHSFIPHKGVIENVRKGVLLSNTNGTTTTYALESLEQRGTMFVGPGTTVYMGMIIGENSKKGDMDVNPVKAKALTNMRTLLKDENVRLTPPRILTLEEAITYIAEDELVEVTPSALRMRKEILDTSTRETMARRAKKSG